MPVAESNAALEVVKLLGRKFVISGGEPEEVEDSFDALGSGRYLGDPSR